MTQAELYKAITSSYPIQTALYPGCGDDFAPSRFIPYVAYLDSGPLAAEFFRDTASLTRQLDKEKIYQEPGSFNFYAVDYNQPPELPQFDLLISRYAGNVGQAMKQYLKPGGILLVTEGPDDAQLAMRDPDYELIGTVKENGGSIGISPGVAPREFMTIPQSEGEEPFCCPIDRVFCFRKTTSERRGC